MNELLQLKINGIKNIENEIVINFINTTVEKGVNNISNVKGIFGYNGAGKTAIITAVDIYKNTATDINYLNQNEVREELSKLVNYKSKQMSVSVLYHVHEGMFLKHLIVLSYKELLDCYYIKEEAISILSDRSINGKYDNLILKKDGAIVEIDDRLASSLTNGLRGADLDFCSIVAYASRKIFDNNDEPNETEEYSAAKKLLLQLYFEASNMYVFLIQSDNRKGYKISKEKINQMLDTLEIDKKIYLENLTDIYSDEEVVPLRLIQNYREENAKLERFIKYFKPELKSIELLEREDKKLVHVRRIFKYQEYNVEYEFESSGVKQLVRLFGYLSKCAYGGIVFIDEIDTNLNSAYFSALISFFAEYGKGQLVFTTHNLEVMNSLKSKSKSILVLGVDNNVDVWVGKGNRSPIKDYLNGNLPNSPMNIEDFDFINIFFGE